MDYLITFLEGVVTFISPCLLPMLPIYLAYFAADATETDGKPGDAGRATAQTVVNACGFVAGMTLVFVFLGALAGSLGGLLKEHQLVLNILCGAVLVVFGCEYAGFVSIPLLKRTFKPQARFAPSGLLKAVLFGIVFSIGWTPCVGVFLGSALMLASASASMLHGIALLVCYALGLGLPFVISALVIEQLSRVFDTIKRHYALIDRVCGIVLIIMGVCLMTGLVGRIMGTLATIS